MESFKKVIGIIFVVVLVVLLGVGMYQSSTKPTTKEAFNKILSTYDEDHVRELKSMINSNDSYCKKCDKYMEGKHRICTYCGQYL